MGEFGAWGPQMAPGVTKTQTAGRYVVRGNPITAVLDAIRGFCFPEPAEATDDGQFLDVAGFPAYTGGGVPEGASTGLLAGLTSLFGVTRPNCGPGTVFDPTTGTCLPAPASETMTMEEAACSPEALARLSAMLLSANLACNLAQIEEVRRVSGSCQRLAPAALRGSWQRLYSESGRVQSDARRRCAMMASTQAAMTQSRMMAPAPPPSLDIGTMTEANVAMRGSIDPMLGMVDPGPLPETRRRPGFGLG